MNLPSKFIVSCLVVAGSVLVIRHGRAALNPALPINMPTNSTFVPSGYDLSRNERKGEWVACHNDYQRGTDLCRVTDARGVVIYQGEFMPLNGSQAVPEDQLKIATEGKEEIWVEGPAEAGPVPIIPLANGAILVPSDDTYALATRWSKNPEELQRLSTE